MTIAKAIKDAFSANRPPPEQETTSRRREVPKARTPRPKARRRVDIRRLHWIIGERKGMRGTVDRGDALSAPSRFTMNDGSVLLGERVEFLARDPIVVDTPGIAAAASVADIIERFARLGAGVTFELAPDGSLIAVSGDGGMPDGWRAAVLDAEPLIAAHLAGDPLLCQWCGAPAVTLLWPGQAAACATHAAESPA